MELLLGQMVQLLEVTGKMIKNMDMQLLQMLVVRNFQAIGKMVSLINWLENEQIKKLI